ncbi:MAG: NAD(P)/FAD-dependent oxidoreductase [Elusimicrobia bacterium]|nr:NAD(P)/FAD-dependent oxidoreductase [Elusimicrobiota bacterium]
MNKKNVIIIGGGPAGLTAGYELVKNKDYNVVIIEKRAILGGIARTESYKGNRIDIGGHRFYSKSDDILKLWTEIMPIQGFPSSDDIITERYRNIDYNTNGPDPEKEDNVMLIRKRTSRIYYMHKFFDYPVALNYNTIRNLGLSKMTKIGLSYMKSMVSPIKNEKNLEDFFINRFGKELYLTFFKDYTEKVWGINCNEIKPDWGAQRVQGLSISSILKDIFLNTFSSRYKTTKAVETTLIRQFYYPKLGPGQMWDEMAKRIEAAGGVIIKNSEVIGINIENDRVLSITTKNKLTGEIANYNADYLISSMPIKDLINAFNKKDENIARLSNELLYRDFIAVGLLMKRMKVKNKSGERTVNNIIPDNWIYLQDSGIVAGRLQIFNNWSPYLLNDVNKIWLGVEYFCNENDHLWSKDDKDLIDIAIKDLSNVGIIDSNDFLDGTAIRTEKAYPAYFGAYEEIDRIKDFLNGIKNLYPIGRNGMHRYNNMDHSMLTGIKAAECILNNTDKTEIWDINTEQEYQEKK